MVLADHHCHISKEYFEDPVQEILDLQAENILEFISIMGVNVENNEEYLQYKTQINSSFLKIGCGLHPAEVIELGEKSKDIFEKVKNQILENKELIDFIGEIGIDFTYENAEKYREEQLFIFKEFCKLGKELGKPLSIHCREAWDEVINIINEVFSEHVEVWNNGCLHCFTGTFEQGILLIEHGFKLGLNGIITFKKSKDLRNVIKELLKKYPSKTFDDLFTLETDTPYLTPEPIRREKNNPRNIILIKKFLEENVL